MQGLSAENLNSIGAILSGQKENSIEYCRRECMDVPEDLGEPGRSPEDQ